MKSRKELKNTFIRKQLMVSTFQKFEFFLKTELDILVEVKIETMIYLVIHF